jgi:hypothetical protein
VGAVCGAEPQAARSSWADTKWLRVLVFALAALGVAAASPWDGNKLYTACERPERSGPHSECAVYTRAVLDRYHEFIASRCPRRQAGIGEIVSGVLAYLEAHRTERDRPAPDLILASVKQRYGCESE